MRYILHESVAFRATALFLLELYELQLTKRFEDGLEIVLGDGEVDVADVETMEWNAVRLGCAAFAGSRLTVLLCFSKLCDDRDAE